jgi:plastocyanin
MLSNPAQREVLNNPTRRDVLRTGVATDATASENTPYDIAMRSDTDGARVWFDPIGLLVPLNSTIRWRIPDGAAPWDSYYLVNPGNAFEVTLTVPGVYDYYCAPHEIGGMVGRIIVQDATGPGTRAFDYFKFRNPDWQQVPDLAQAAFPSIESILKNNVVYL